MGFRLNCSGHGRSSRASRRLPLRPQESEQKGRGTGVRLRGTFKGVDRMDDELDVAVREDRRGRAQDSSPEQLEKRWPLPETGAAAVEWLW